MSRNFAVHLSVPPNMSPMYIPFDGVAAGAKRGFHTLRIGLDDRHNIKQHVREWALRIFPLAQVESVEETNILGEPLTPACKVQQQPNNGDNTMALTLKDHGDGGEPGFDDKGVAVTIQGDERWLWIGVEGYGEASAKDGHGFPIGLEYYNGRLRLIVYSDINEQDPQIIDMEDARESNRREVRVSTVVWPTIRG